MSDKPAVLFITYDGLLDPLGASQILPYIYGIASHPRAVHILSFEKLERLSFGKEKLHEQLSARGIGWTSLSFTKRFGRFGKLWDLARMYFWGIRLATINQIQIVHARGQPTAQVGLFIKRLLGTKLIFDFRGLWVDERVDKGGWNLERPFHRLQYRYFKMVERKLLAKADQVVVLTQAVVNEVIKLGAAPASKITVIPCCADFDHFPIRPNAYKDSIRVSLGIPEGSLILGYLGSVGRIYMLDRFFRFFALAAYQRQNIHALVITQDVAVLTTIMQTCLPNELCARVHIKSASRDEVPDVIAAMDVMASFVQPSYARISMSPTKLAECYSAGIPVICNSGVGDVAEQMQQLGAGVIVNPSSDSELSAVSERLDEVCAMGGVRLREVARKMLGLEVAEARYKCVYSKLN